MAHTGFRQQRGMLCAKLREPSFTSDLGGLCALLTEREVLCSLSCTPPAQTAHETPFNVEHFTT